MQGKSGAHCNKAVKALQLREGQAGHNLLCMLRSLRLHNCALDAYKECIASYARPHCP